MTSAESLRRLVRGDVFAPGDDGYGATTHTWDLATVDRPPLALAASSIEDIAAGTRWADDNGLGIALLNTGHGAFSAHADALVIAVGRLNTVQVDSRTRRATVAPGARWADVSTVAGPLGLAGAAGGSAGVGVLGYTLGGGLGPLGRTLGFAADRVTSLTVLDADHRPQRVDARDGELFWALRGGGPLGVVTELEFELGRVPAFFGGGVYFDGTDAAALLTSYAEWVTGLDERTTTSIALIQLPPAPQLPPQLRSRFVVHLRIAHIDAEAHDLTADGRRLLAPLLSTAPAIADATRVMTPLDLPDIHRDPVDAQNVAYRGGFVDRLDAATVSAIVAAMPSDSALSPRMIEIRHLGGAYARSPIAPNSSTGRDARFNLYVTASSTPDSAIAARSLVDGTAARISHSPRGQFNFYGPAPLPGSILRLWDAPEAARLLAVADMLDPRDRIRTGRPLR